jgi:hypothetical protein
MSESLPKGEQIRCSTHAFGDKPPLDVLCTHPEARRSARSHACSAIAGRQYCDNHLPRPRRTNANSKPACNGTRAHTGGHPSFQMQYLRASREALLRSACLKRAASAKSRKPAGRLDGGKTSLICRSRKRTTSRFLQMMIGWTLL